MNKIVSTKRTSAIFLAIVLVTGTIATLSFPTFMTISAAQAQQYYGDRMDNDYNSYGPPEYPSYKPDYKPAYPSYDGKDKRQIQR